MVTAGPRHEVGEALNRLPGPDLSQFLTALDDLLDYGERGLASFDSVAGYREVDTARISRRSRAP